MITWLQTFFLKHNKWLFGGLLIVIIVTFVLTIGPQSFFGSGSGASKRSLQFHGYDLASETDQRTIAQHAEISSFLNPELQIGRDQVMNYAYIRIAALGMANKLGIPEPSDENLKTFIQSLRAFQDPTTNTFSADTYQRMMDLVDNSGRFETNIMGKVLREDYRIAEVRQALGGPDYTLPFEVDQAFIDAKSNYAVSLLHFDLDAFNPPIVATEDALRDFFEQNPARYEIDEQISVTALKFTGEAYLSEIDDPEGDVLEAYFAANKAKYQTPATETDAEGEPAETPEVLLEDVLEAVIADWKDEQAITLAARKCEQFSIQLWQQKVEAQSPEYEAMLEEFAVEQLAVPAYSRQDIPRTTGLPFQLFESVWAYANNSSRYFSDLASTNNGAALLVINEVIDARQPAFEEVTESVRDDYMESEKRRLFAEKGKELRDQLLASIQDKDLATLAEELELELSEIDPFNGDRVPFSLRRNQLWEQVQFLEPGEMTPMIINDNRGTFAYLSEKALPELDPEAEDYQDFLNLRGSRSDNAMGWARIRQITDQGLEALFPSNPETE